MPNYCILALDGGGIRGLYTAVLLDRLIQEAPGFTDRADLLAGTSTGGILALGLAHGMGTKELIALYENNGKAIFSASVWHKIKEAGNWIGARYNNDDLVRIVRGTFGEARLGDLRQHVVVPSFDLASDAMPPIWKPKFFQNFEGPGSDKDEKVADVALRTSAAPTFFPSYQGYVDGGVVANNPAMAALAQAIDVGTGNQRLEDLHVFSVGTGVTPHSESGDTLNWGLAQWAPVLANMMIEGMMGVADYECARLLGNRYFRLSPQLQTEIPLDCADDIAILVEYANQVDITDAVAWLKANFV